MASTRTVTAVLRKPDGRKLAEDGYYLQIAKGMVTGAGQAPKFNLVWTSEEPQSSLPVKWGAGYGLGWVERFPRQGETLTPANIWQAVARGQNITLKSDGSWDIPTSGGVDGFLTVRSELSYPGPGVHLIVGLQRDDRHWDPIFTDPTPIPKGGSARYSPSDIIQFWYQHRELYRRLISNDGSDVLEIDCTNPTQSQGKYEWWIRYVTAGPKKGWTKSESELNPWDPEESDLDP